MKVWVIIENSYLPYEYNEDEIHSVVDSELKAKTFVAENPPVKNRDSGTLSYRYVEKEIK